MSDIRPVPGDTDGLDELRRLAAIGYGICLSTATVQETLVPMLAEYDRRGAEIEHLTGLVRAVSGDLERRDAELARVRRDLTHASAYLDAADRPVLDGVHALALGSIARDVGLTAEASGAFVALTVADRIEELERLRGQREAAIALHERREAASAAGGSTVWCEGCSARKGEIVSWPCADARALGVEEDTRG